MEIICDEIFEKHLTGEGHPEIPERVRVIREGFQKISEKWSFHSAQSCNIDKLKSVHPPGYIDKVKKYSRSEQPLAGDTPLCADSYEIALKAVGSALKLGELAVEGKNGFGALRPPGHHAGRQKGMGFCLFNNIAVLAQQLSEQGLKPAVVDIDVHHGNGTQDIFYEQAEILYLSLHQHPFYPGTGTGDETGAGAGAGTTVNIPLPAGAGWNTVEPEWQEKALPALAEFEPDILLISAGFDAHRTDPLGGLNLTDDDYLKIAVDLRKLAQKQCEGRIVGLLEGGYNIETLGRLVPAFVRELCPG